MPRSWLPSEGPRDETARCVDRARRGDARGRRHRDPSRGVAVLGIGASAAALAWIVFLGSVATLRSAGFVGVPAALQMGLAALSVVIVVAGLVALVGFAAASWRLGDALFRVPRLRRYNGR